MKNKYMFYYALVFYLLFRILYGSNFRYEEVLPKFVLYALYTLSCLFSILKILVSFKYSVLRNLMGAILIVLSIYYYLNYSYYILAPILLIFAARNISFDGVLKTQYNTTKIMLYASLIAVALGVITDLHFPKSVPILNGGGIFRLQLMD